MWSPINSLSVLDENSKERFSKERHPSWQPASSWITNFDETFLLFITLFAFDFFGHETSKRQISSSIRCCKRHRPGSYNINDEHNSLFFYLELLSMLFCQLPPGIDPSKGHRKTIAIQLSGQNLQTMKRKLYFYFSTQHISTFYV
jgi:hypothetical protein